jgi:hypothetical protein
VADRVKRRAAPRGRIQLRVRWSPRTVPSKIDFYGLARPVQDRFAAATHLLAPPAPLLVQNVRRTAAWVFLAAAAVLLVIEGALLSAGWGDVQNPLAIHGPKMVTVDVVLLATALYCVLRALGIVSTLDALPWRPGLYVFPGCVVDARRPTLDVWPMEMVESVDRLAAPAFGLVFRMRDGSRVAVRAPSAARAEQAAAALEPRRRDLALALESGDLQTVAELDPLHDRAMSSPIGPTEAMTPARPHWIRFDWAIAAVLGFVLGQGLAAARNAWSDAAAYRAVTQDGSAKAYEQYLAQRGKHSDEVRDVLLPRVQLREAEAKGTVEAVRAFAEAHADSKIGAEIDASLRRALLIELEKAKRPGTVSALDAFARKYPAPVVGAELRAARHALFVRALATWRARAHPDAPTEALMDRLLAWTEQNGPRCEVRFRERPSTSMADADRSVMRSPRYPGPEALPSRYLTADSLRQNETGVIDSVVKQFADVFPADVLSAHAAEPLGADDPAPSSVPALVIDYAPEWSRGNTTCPKPLTVFVGLSFEFAATFSTPDGPPWKATVKTWRAAESWKIKGQGLSLEDFEEKVYGAMVDGAFDQLRRRLGDALF